jgi:hypothetical protein
MVVVDGGEEEVAAMFLLAVVIVALATLFFLTALALGAAGEMRHPVRSVVAVVAALIVGIALLYEYGVAG